MQRGQLSNMFSPDKGLEVTLWSQIGLLVFSRCHHGDSDLLTGCWHSKRFLTFASSWLRVWLWELLVPEHLLEGWLSYHSLKTYQFISNHQTPFHMVLVRFCGFSQTWKIFLLTIKVNLHQKKVPWFTRCSVCWTSSCGWIAVLVPGYAFVKRSAWYNTISI